MKVAIGCYTDDDVDLRLVDAENLQDAVRIVQAAIHEDVISSRDWAGGEVWDQDRCVAVIAYNGRAFSPGKKNPEGLRVPDLDRPLELQVPIV